ncbi:MAG: NUDIX hydrolase [Gammaproteobacteria bacterium]|nr:NUDIX hydrolase [Gammaproteobacteria bacterium]
MGLFRYRAGQFRLTDSLMHRQPLLNLLRAYADRHPQERATADMFIDFVERNPRCFERELAEGHVTGSAWLVDRSGGSVLLTHHRKLGRWLQLGGHSDGNPTTLAVAMQEAGEESGLSITPLSEDIFDLDVHEIPARRDEPAHLHFDVRFALQTLGDETFQVSGESLDLAWVPIARLGDYTEEESVLRMARKWRECTG